MLILYTWLGTLVTFYGIYRTSKRRTVDALDVILLFAFWPLWAVLMLIDFVVKILKWVRHR